MFVTLNWVINHSELNNLNCLAANEYIENKIESVNILDNPDVLKWIKRNEFVLTTGYILKDNELLQRSIVRELKEIGCAALGVKIKRFFDTVPEAMITEAKLVGLPIIEIPFYYPFSDISKIVYTELYKNNLHSSESQFSIIEKISSFYFENESIDLSIKTLSKFLSKSVLLLDFNYNLISAHLIKDHNYVLENSNILDLNISDFEAPITFNKHSDEDDVYNLFSINNYTFNSYIKVLPNSLGALCIINNDIEKINFEERSFLNKISTIIALHFEKLSLSNVNKYHNFLFDYLLSNEEISEEDVKELCNFYGFNFFKKRICITISIDDTGNDFNSKQVFKYIDNSIAEIFSREFEYFVCFNDNIFSVFLFFNDDMDNVVATNTALDSMAYLEDLLNKTISHDFVIGISRIHKDISLIRTSFKESLESINIGKKLIHLSDTVYSNKTINGDVFQNGRINSYNHQLIYHLLNRLPKADLEKIYCDNILPLINYDLENNSNLIEIFKMYFICKFNSKETSEKLFIHRNTLLNKLDRIRNLLSSDLNDYDCLLSIYIGICAYELSL